ncbi:MAG: nuclear transport factor 2 family protein [Rhodoferax sp.]|nr:nuclear transport factor 2 family protein [Rhodoferax sp.]MCF8211470.1 nuclear transport factor 2 family protein [Rhodoferax sp.]
MAKTPQQVAALGGTPDDVECAFYEALQAADLDRLMACWADEDDIVCIHPGGMRVVGVGAIRAAFDHIFAHSGSLRVKPEAIRRVEAMGSAVHSVVERIEVLTPEGPVYAHLLASNVYHKTAQGWRLVLHHASPGSQGDAQEVVQAPQVLH